jgi:hypothetical protein
MKHGILTEGKRSVRLTSLYLLIQISCFGYSKYISKLAIYQGFNCREFSLQWGFPGCGLLDSEKGFREISGWKFLKYNFFWNRSGFNLQYFVDLKKLLYNKMETSSQYGGAMTLSMTTFDIKACSVRIKSAMQSIMVKSQWKTISWNQCTRWQYLP